MTGPQTTGATSVAKKRTIWPWVLLAVVIVALLLWWLIAALNGDDDAADASASIDTTSTAEQTSPSNDAEATDSAGSTTDAGSTTSPGSVPVIVVPGAVLVGDLDALDPNTDLSASVGEPVTADSVQVQVAIADEAFYVGPEAGQTVLVRLQPFAGTGQPESPVTYEAGDTVSFTGTLEQVDEAFLTDLQLYDPSGQFQVGDYYVQASEVTVVG